MSAVDEEAENTIHSSQSLHPEGGEKLSEGRHRPRKDSSVDEEADLVFPSSQSLHPEEKERLSTIQIVNQQVAEEENAVDRVIEELEEEFETRKRQLVEKTRLALTGEMTVSAV